jgi:hypothetical protein
MRCAQHAVGALKRPAPASPRHVEFRPRNKRRPTPPPPVPGGLHPSRRRGQRATRPADPRLPGVLVLLPTRRRRRLSHDGAGRGRSRRGTGPGRDCGDPRRPLLGRRRRLHRWAAPPRRLHRCGAPERPLHRREGPGRATSADTMPGPGDPDGHVVPRGRRLRGRFPADTLPAWLTPEDPDVYAGEFERTGMTGALNRYRNMDRDWQDAAWEGRPVTPADVVHRRGPRRLHHLDGRCHRGLPDDPPEARWSTHPRCRRPQVSADRMAAPRGAAGGGLRR